MLDDLRPYIYKTPDGGRTWTDISGNLPAKAYVWVVREDPRNPNLLYAGTELGLYASYSGGNWIPLHLKNLPTVAVHDITVHPRENDLILATHGRGFWIFDDATALQQINAQVLASGAHLFEPRPALRFTTRFTRYGIGNKVFTGSNPPYGAVITYYLKDAPGEKTAVKLQILASDGKLIRELAAIPKEAGLNRATWDLRHEPPRLRQPPRDEEVEFGGGPRGPQVSPGTYTVRLVAGDTAREQRLTVRLDPTITIPAADLQAQFDHALKLRDMHSAVTDAQLAIENIKQQLQQLERTIRERLPEAPKELTQAVAEHLKQAESLEGLLARPPEAPRYRMGPRLVEQVSQFAASVNGVNAAPTPAQRAYFAELQTEFRKTMGEVNAWIERALPRLNETLARHQVPTLLIGKPIDLPR